MRKHAGGMHRTRLQALGEDGRQHVQRLSHQRLARIRVAQPQQEHEDLRPGQPSDTRFTPCASAAATERAEVQYL